MQKSLAIKSFFFMFLAKFVVVSHLKIHPAVHLNTTKALSLLKI